MKLDALDIAFIRTEEGGAVLHAYDDHDSKRVTYNQATGRYERADGSPPIGFATIGVGHLLRPGETWDTITVEQADELLRRNLADVEAAVNRQIPETTEGWNLNRYSAACSFSFNCGTMSLTKYGITPLILAGRYDECEAPWKAIVKSKGAVLPGLVKRRAREFALFCKPVEIAWGPADVAKVLASVHATADAETEAFRAGSPLPSEDVPPTDRNS